MLPISPNTIPRSVFKLTNPHTYFSRPLNSTSLWVGNIPEIEGLERGQGLRVEPTWELQDIAQIFEPPKYFPFPLTFWDRSAEERTRHRNPLFDVVGASVTIGLTFMNLAIDVMHTIYLGLAQYITVIILWRLLDGDSWELHTGTVEERTELGVQIMLRDLFAWYSERAAQFPNEKLTHLQTLKTSMLGESEIGPLKTKAAETYGLLLFALDAVLKHSTKIKQSKELHECGAELLKVLTIMKREGAKLSTEAYKEQQYLDAAVIPITMFLFYPKWRRNLI